MGFRGIVKTNFHKWDFVLKLCTQEGSTVTAGRRDQGIWVCHKKDSDRIKSFLEGFRGSTGMPG